MNPLTAVGVAANAIFSACTFARRPRIWAPFLIVLLLQALGLVLLVFFHRPVVLPVGLPLVQFLGGESATHYLAFHLALPAMLEKVDRFVSILVASIATGAATVLFARAFGLVDAESAWKRAYRRAPALVLTAAFTTGAFFALSSIMRLVPDDAFAASPAFALVRELARLAAFVIVQSLLAYATAWIVLGGRRAFGAIVESVRVTGRTLAPTLLVVGIPAVVLYPLHVATAHSHAIVGRFKPEVVTWLLSARLLADALAAFVVVGAITRLYTWRMRHIT